MRRSIRPFMVFYLLAIVEFGFGGWAFYAILTRSGSEFPTVGVLLAVVGLVAVFLGVRLHRRDRLRRRLLATGDPGTAEIIGLAQTGSSQNYVPMFRITMLVHSGAHGVYEKTVKEYLTYDKIDAASPGSKVVVRIDHDDREKVAIDWSAHAQARPRSRG